MLGDLSSNFLIDNFMRRVEKKGRGYFSSYEF